MEKKNAKAQSVLDLVNFKHLENNSHHASCENVNNNPRDVA